MDPKVQDGDAAFRRPVSAAAGRAGPEDRLTSARTRQTMSSQLDELSRTVISNNPRTLEDLVRDMVRPLLREWLEANLPAIVERQVRQEIDRLSHSGR
jgi:cell pole-organizing protein PopZ